MNEFEWHLLEDKPRIDRLSIGGVEIAPGARVRLCPRQGGDIFDSVLAGKIAIVEAFEQDYEGKIQVAVVIEDDPGKDLGFARQPGHRFFFDTGEIEPAGDAKP